MTEQEFDVLVELMQSIAWHATGRATHQQRAGSIDEDIELAKERIDFTEDE